jgi:hypothetical protein
MGKTMDKRKKKKMMIRGAVVFAAILVLVRTIKKVDKTRSYGPMHETDRREIEYLNSKIGKCDVTCRNMLRFEKAHFFELSNIPWDHKLLEDRVHLNVEQQVALFFHTWNRAVETNFGRPFSTISIYFECVLHTIGELRNEYIILQSLETPENSRKPSV